MTEFERRADLRGKLGEKRVKRRKIFLEVRRKLEQQRTELVAQRACDLTEAVEERCDVPEPAVVRDPSRGFQGQPVRRGRLRGPPADQLFVRHPVERVIDLDGR